MNLPRGIRSVLNNYSAMIAERLYDIHGIQIDYEMMLGCGHWGCVFAISNDATRVIKISLDPTEGPVVAAIMMSGVTNVYDGIVKYDAVYKLPDRIIGGKRHTAYIIVRENVIPYLSEYRYSKSLKYLCDYNRAAFKYMTLKSFKKQHYHDIMMENLGQLFNFQETYYIAEVIEALYHKNIILVDVHTGNLGYRLNETVMWSNGRIGAKLIIFDPGHSFTNIRIPIPYLWMPEPKFIDPYEA